MNVQYPKITGQSSEEQLKQIRSYLYQLAEQLNMETGSNNGERISLHATLGRNDRGGGSQGDGAEVAAGTPGSTFNQIKSLIIKSAEIVDAYSEEIKNRLTGHYVAQSEYGTYKQEVNAALEGNAEKIEQNYSNLQTITGQLKWVNDTKATIRSGMLFEVGEKEREELEKLGQTFSDGTPIYGIEIGQTSETTVDGETVATFSKFARFTSYGMTLYKKDGTLVAWFTDAGMHVPDATIHKTLTVGGFQEKVDADGGTVERWVGK